VKPGANALEALLAGHHDDPFSLLGPHAGPKGTFVRVLKPHVEGMLMHGQGVDVGDKLRVKLTSADPRRGFIDFVRE